MARMEQELQDRDRRREFVNGRGRGRGYDIGPDPGTVLHQVAISAWCS